MPKKKAELPVKKIYERVTSGITGLDKYIGGGFIKGSTILVSGSTGSGKTIFCSQFIMEGLKNGENCMFITLEEEPEELIDDVKEFGWDFKKYIDEGHLFLEYKDPLQLLDITGPLLEKIQQKNVKRIVVDSTSALEIYFEKESEIRKELFKLLKELKKIKVTSLLTSELPEASGGQRYEKLAKFGVEEFLVDAVISLYYFGIGNFSSNTMEIRKMRRTNHVRESLLFVFGKDGISVKDVEKIG
jgi:circadian clock protein KaiC